MKLRDYALEQLAEMVIGDNKAFPYKSSYYITQFFDRCGFPFIHDGSTRKRWTLDRLKELNDGVCQSPDLPSNDLLRVVIEMLDLDDFDRNQKSRDVALVHLNKAFSRDGLVGSFADDGALQIRHSGSGACSVNMTPQTRPLSSEEISQRAKIVAFLDSASEDEFTERLVVPLFRRLGFHRVSPSGHTEKTMEYGKDLWMKFQLPTGHWLYFGAQIKRDKLDAKGNSGDTNTATVLNQVRMAIDHPVFDPDTNRKALLDHVFIICAGEITRSARAWLVEKLDQGQRRHLIFMDRDEFLDHAARILMDLKIESTSSAMNPDDIPF